MKLFTGHGLTHLSDGCFFEVMTVFFNFVLENSTGPCEVVVSYGRMWVLKEYEL